MAEESGYAVIGTVDVLPEYKQQVFSALCAHRDRCLREERGTLRLDLLIADDDDHRLLTYELYRDQAAYAEHKRGASMQEVLSELRGKVRAMSSMRGQLLS